MVNAISRPVVCPVLIEREPYLAALGAALDRARAGEGQAVLISGEAGIGKTRLLAELTSLATTRGVRVVRANCYEADRAVPFGPLLDLLRSLATGERDPGLADALCRADPCLLTLAPELAPLLPELPAAQPPLEPEQRQRRLFAALADLLLDLARERPLLVAVEDAHWSDDTSLEFLLHLARRLAGAPLLLAVTYRNDEPTPALRHALAELDRARLATEAALAPLDEAGVAAMLRAIFGLERLPSGDLLRALHGLTEGNPFFIEEVLHVLVAAGDIFYADGRWDRKPLDELSIPRSIHDAVQRRTLRLSPAAADALKLAAVLGRRFDLAVLQRVGGYDEPVLLAILKELVAAQLLVEEPDDRVAFRHALTRRAVYAELLARERRALHRAVAESVERLAGDASAAPDAYLAELAYHTFAAGQWERALDHTRRVGERALGLYAPGAAVEYFTRALEAADHLHVPAPLDVLRGRASAYETLGDFDRARADYERALLLAREAGDWRGEWRTLRDLGMLWSGRDYAQAGPAYRLAHECALASGDALTIARSLNSLGNWLLNVDEPQEALRHHQEALAVFESLGDRHGIAETLDFLGMASYLSGDLIAGTRHYERAVPLLRELGDRKLLCSALATMTLRGMTWQTDTMVPAAENLPASMAQAREALAVAREINRPAGEAFAHVTLTYALASHGDYAEALASVRAGMDVALEIEHRQWLSGLGCIGGALHLDLFALDKALATLTEARRLARAISSWHWIRCTSGFLAVCHIERGELDEAEVVLSEALPPGTPMLALGQRQSWAARARLALARGEPARALDIADQLAGVPHARGPEDLSRVAWLRGQALAALHRHDEAERMLLAAACLAEQHEARPLLWRARADLARLYLATERRDDAERQVAATSALIAELAANIPDDTLRATFEQRATASLPPLKPLPARRPAALPGGLTAREREVAIHVALGRSNRAIAEQLILSERTVETHVANILGKLSFNARAQIAAWVAMHGLITLPPGG